MSYEHSFHPETSAYLPSMMEGYWVEIYPRQLKLFLPKQGLCARWYIVTVYAHNKHSSYGNNEFLVSAIRDGSDDEPHIAVKQMLRQERHTNKLVGANSDEIADWLVGNPALIHYESHVPRRRAHIKAELVKAIEDKLSAMEKELQKPSK
jgi:hypothetical protein